MRERAKKALLKLKEKDKYLQEQFNSYVALLMETLEIKEEQAVTLVTEELVNRNQKRLMLEELFSKDTLASIK